MKTRASAVFGLVVCLTVAAAAAESPPPVPVLRIAADHVMGHVSPRHAGLMTEEINHCYDGGLYAELVANRGLRDDIPVGYTEPPHWRRIRDGVIAGEVGLDQTGGISAALPASLRVDASDASGAHPVGTANDGWWGIPARPATSYRASFYARIDGAAPLPLTLAITGPAGTAPFAHATVELKPGGWRRYEATLVTAGGFAPTAQARLMLTTTTPGVFHLSLVSLFPPTWHDRPNGNRIDLMQRLADLKPAFLRFPGGNYLEGNSLPDRFDWKKTLGDLTDRAGHNCPWGYRSSDGLGLLEFMHWCEDLGMEPVLGVFAGLTLDQRAVKPGASLAPFVQDALDEIEFLTGDASTTWGARRIALGHPEPFKLTYVEIGNEDWEENSDYDGRFAQFYDAFKAKYPALQLIATKAVKSRVPDVLDDHYYRKAGEFFRDVHHYDKADRKGPKIFVGEWATWEGSPTPHFGAALGDAAWMTGMERNSDLIIMQAYAPLFTNVNPHAAQWHTNLIGYDAISSYGSPAYYAQQMFNRHRGDEILDATPDVAENLFHSVTRDSRTGRIFVKVVNAEPTARDVRLEIAGVARVGPEAKLVVLTAGSLTDTNTITEPEKIVPVESTLKDAGTAFRHTFPGYSISVITLDTK